MTFSQKRETFSWFDEFTDFSGFTGFLATLVAKNSQIQTMKLLIGTGFLSNSGSIAMPQIVKDLNLNRLSYFPSKNVDIAASQLSNDLNLDLELLDNLHDLHNNKNHIPQDDFKIRIDKLIKGLNNYSKKSTNQYNTNEIYGIDALIGLSNYHLALEKTIPNKNLLDFY